MTSIVALGSVILLSAFAQTDVADKPSNDLTALELKICREWIGQGPCDGRLTISRDGEYEWRQHGPGGNNSAGTWKTRWDALPPTLILFCTISDNPLYLRKSEVRLLQLDNATLAFKHADAHGAPERYFRMP